MSNFLGTEKENSLDFGDQKESRTCEFLLKP